MNATDDPLGSLRHALGDLANALAEAEAPAAVMGAVAASLLARPRLTRDIDVLADVSEKTWPAFLAAMAQHGFESRSAAPLEFAESLRVFPLQHTPSGVNLDVVLAQLPYERGVLARAEKRAAGPVEVTVVSPEDLIIMKAVANRPRDWADVEAVIEAAPRLDWEYILDWARQFGEALDASDFVDRLETLRSQSP